MKDLRTQIFLVAVMLVLGAFCTDARANLTLGFNNITANNIGDAAIGEAKLSVDIIDIGGDQVKFVFHNDGPGTSSITDIYFRDGSVLFFDSLIDFDDGVGGDAGVDFSPGASPPELPGASQAWKDAQFFATDSDTPNVYLKGVNNGNPTGEWLGVVFDINTPDFSYADVESQFLSHDMEIGLHVQGFVSEGSESFINNGIIPAPGAILLGGIGVGLVGWLRRRRTL